MPYLIPTNTCFGLAASITDPQWYNDIFELKNRPHSKPLAILVESFEWLASHTSLTSEQIHFLEHYPRPFSILTASDFLENFFAEQSRFDHQYYQKYSLRVAHTPEQIKLIQEVWPLFLTSANLSWEKEIYSRSELESTFSESLSSGEIEKIWPFIDLSPTPPSEIFSFKGNSLDQEFLRS